jgi:TnpA family transposase
LLLASLCFSPGVKISALGLFLLLRSPTHFPTQELAASWRIPTGNQPKKPVDELNSQHMDVTQAWGEGRTSSSNGQRFRLKSQLLQRTYSHRFQNYALEFYSFVADNYAPFYSTPIECTDRDAAYVLDGLLYNESELDLEEHYTDTHGYTEINFAAFGMLGRRFAPRIQGLKNQRIYRIDTKQRTMGRCPHW